MSLHIICCNRTCLAVIGYTPDTNLVWSFVAQHTKEASVNSFSPSRLGIECAFSSVRVVGSCTLAVELNVINFILDEMMREDLATRVEESIDWTNDVPTSLDVKNVEDLMSQLSRNFFVQPSTNFNA